MLGASPEVRTSRREAGPAPRAWRGAGGLRPVPVPSRAEPWQCGLSWVVRLEGRAVSLCAHAGSPSAWIPPLPGQPALPSVSAQKSPPWRGLPQPPGIKATHSTPFSSYPGFFWVLILDLFFPGSRPRCKFPNLTALCLFIYKNRQKNGTFPAPTPTVFKTLVMKHELVMRS